MHIESSSLDPRTIVRSMLCVMAFGIAFLMNASMAVANNPPPWLAQAAAMNPPAYDRNIPAVVLLKEQAVTVESNGRVTTTERYAVRILSRDGRGAAMSAALYRTDSSKVRDFRAWILPSTGRARQIPKNRILDIGAVDNDVYNEVRVRAVHARDEVEPGYVFGCEWIVEERSVFTQFEWLFQSRLPVLLSRFEISVPGGWKADSVVFNHGRIEPRVSGSTYSWELRNLPYIEAEPASPAVSNISPRLAVSYFPADGAGSNVGPSFDRWEQVAQWLSQLSDSQLTINDALSSKARELTSGARTEFDRIQAIARHAQSINYISIQTGVGRGGGYRPRSAVDVFARSYGDCKDKANLMRAMLKAIGIDSYLVSIYSGDPTYVREEWPSPQQFNHCIIAVKVSDETKAETVVEHPTLGRLMIFDPTDDVTPLGDLPDHQQGSLALLIAREGGMLLRMPTTPPEANGLEREAEVRLSPNGSIVATIRETSSGQSAAAFRRQYRYQSRPDFLKAIERWITRGATGASLTRVEPMDDTPDGRFGLELEFTAERYAQLMQGRLLVFKPAIVSRRETLFLTEDSRTHPVVLRPQAYSETVRVKLPEGFDIDEMPRGVSLRESFGEYETTYEVDGTALVFTRRMRVLGGTIPSREYEKVRAFYGRVLQAEQAPVVLVKR